ncbi:MAG: AmmeMemoRadiSam system protein B [Dehalococcoidia bacterium]|nr:AmmeMemoRadiSam system protein B [Dehalococcoidia bacterium]
MTGASIPLKPKVRQVEPMWVEHMGQRFLYLRDPIAMSESTIMLPSYLAPIVVFLDGTRDIAEIRAAMALRAGLDLSEDDLRSVIRQLDQALMIENGEFRRAHRRAVESFRREDFRPPSHAGAVYPESADQLHEAIGDWCDRFQPDTPLSRPEGNLVGMLSPHIDYNRGHATYARLWQQAQDDLDSIELVIVLGTDHQGGLGRVTPTFQSYHTPYGTLPTDSAMVEELAQVIGKSAFDEELHHKSEHSIELALVWMHHFMRGREVATLPILCGSFHHFVGGDTSPSDDGSLTGVLDVLRRAMERRNTLVIAAGDLAHVGPAFGDAMPLDDLAKTKLKTEDDVSIAAIRSGNPQDFLDISVAESDARKICGLSPIYLMLSLLEGATGVHMGYDQCPADHNGGSVVSIAGALLYA